MRAIIIAGGKGRRLKPYTTLIPKPLVPIGNKFTILELIIIQLLLVVNQFAKKSEVNNSSPNGLCNHQADLGFFILRAFFFYALIQIF